MIATGPFVKNDPYPRLYNKERRQREVRVSCCIGSVDPTHLTVSVKTWEGFSRYHTKTSTYEYYIKLLYGMNQLESVNYFITDGTNDKNLFKANILINLRQCLIPCRVCKFRCIASIHVYTADFEVEWIVTFANRRMLKQTFSSGKSLFMPGIFSGGPYVL